MIEVTQSDVDTMRELVASGDIKLEEVRAKFEEHFERKTRLDDDRLLIAIAAQQDDDDDELVENIISVEMGHYKIVAPSKEGAA